ncbi:MAG: class I SAM-dependent methyltransferase [Anaerococcus sp.]|nr:class I SAM-dependent methyltransferase [Anaerococcus sp.]MDD7044092.1 class I SAM-dependent methyltransferase [Peptoniphilaceae bacterium]MDY2918166.1 class I SAM-dependent methyltransferase [Anaerococcus sp.]
MYEDFAYIYDKLSFDIDYERYAQNIKDLCKKYQVGKENMLELAAGSGMLTRHFFDDFEKIDALDISPDMLKVFAQKYDADNVNLIYYDMVSFINEKTYDLIVILLDSVNYVTEKEELIELFENSYKNLKDDSLLVFDINSEYKIKEIFGSKCYVYEYEDIFYTWDNFFEDDLCDMHLDFFIREEGDTYRRIREFQQERLYKVEEIKEILENIGFSHIEICDEDDMGELKPDTMRILFSAKKEKNE